jgi:hypothetical protein
LSASSLQEARGFGAESVQKRENFVAFGRRFATPFLDIFEGYLWLYEKATRRHTFSAYKAHERSVLSNE